MEINKHCEAWSSVLYSEICSVSSNTRYIARLTVWSPKRKKIKTFCSSKTEKSTDPNESTDCFRDARRRIDGYVCVRLPIMPPWPRTKLHWSRTNELYDDMRCCWALAGIAFDVVVVALCYAPSHCTSILASYTLYLHETQSFYNIFIWTTDKNTFSFWLTARAWRFLFIAFLWMYFISCIWNG